MVFIELGFGFSLPFTILYSYSKEPLSSTYANLPVPSSVTFSAELTGTVEVFFKVPFD